MHQGFWGWVYRTGQKRSNAGEHAFTETECGASPISTREYTPSADSDDLEHTQLTEPSHVLYWKHHQTYLSANYQRPVTPVLDMSSLVVPIIALVRHGGHYMSLPSVLTASSVELLGGSGA
jgi:hypothetical protein